MGARRTGASRAREARRAALAADLGVPLSAAVLATIAIAALARSDAPEARTGRTAVPGVPGLSVINQNPTPTVASAGAITGLNSRFVTRAALEIWGRTTAPDGCTIKLWIDRPRAPLVKLPAAPAVNGGFHAMARVPADLQGRRLEIRAMVSCI